jgi:hypothetical protein
MPESKYSVFNLALQVENMRNAQKLYFEQIGKAKKTHLPEDYALAKKTLNISKLLEISVDDTLLEIRKESSTNGN